MTRQHEASQRAFQKILLNHLHLYAEMAVEDLYKLVFQAAMGAEHAVASAAHCHRRLAAEAATVRADADGPLSVPLSPDHGLVRIHISPFMNRGGDLQALSMAHVQTSRTFQPSTRRLRRYWSWAQEMAARERLPFTHASLLAYGQRRRSQGYPAVHHSSRYRRLYAPAYRVVLKSLISRINQSANQRFNE